jgi:exopolysaccharide production protein ExoZ
MMRGVAACGVVLLHARFTAPIDFTHSWARLGAAGVDLFFVISGFIMASIKDRSTTEFLSDRFWRIMPLWWLLSIPWLLFANFNWATLAATLTLWPAFGEFTKPALGVGWTLSFEMLFYASLALSMRVGAAPILVAFGLSLLGAVTSDLPLFDWIGNPIIFEFLMGYLIARLPRDTRVALPMLMLAVALFALSPLEIYKWEIAVDADLSWMRTVFWGFPSALLVYAAISFEKSARSSICDAAVVLGNASYSIYLIHLAVILTVQMYWGLEFLLAIGAGVLVWKFVETPILKAKPGRRSACGLSPELHADVVGCGER